jgi:16S rRNA (guanine966-N2)-methyltransferase
MTNIRITGGEARGRSITGPSGLEARPTASKIRQAFFNILHNKLDGARFLDIFAGTGLMGIEALSRGAEQLVCIDESRKMVRTIEANLTKIGYEAKVICGDYRRFLPTLETNYFDIIFADPPYAARYELPLLELLNKHDVLKPDGLLAIEHSIDTKLPEESGSFQKKDARTWGQTAITFYVRKD